MSPNGKLSVNDLLHAYLKFNVKRHFIYITENLLAQATRIFLRDKQAANLISQARFYCNDTLVVDKLDFVDEVNIL
jgi:hypothetical protein